MNDECIFCKVVSKKRHEYIIYEDKNFLAFLDEFPIAEGHTLIIPKKHYPLVWDVEEIGEYMQVCKMIVNHFEKITGQKIVYSMIHGKGVAHAHIHILPKISKDMDDQFAKAFPRGVLNDNDAKRIIEVYGMN